LALAATVVASAAVLLYVLLIIRQARSGDLADSRLIVMVGVLLIGLAGLTALGAVASSRRARRASLAAAAVGWCVLGYFALWSVGLLLLLAGVLAVLALARDRDAIA
jgi:chromate transport protein ChrA